MKTFDLGLLAALDALLATRSVTRAAERMHLSTPAMSHTLARIREAVGDPVLVRAGRRLVPTPRALELAEPVARLLAEAQALLAPGAARGLAGVRRRFVVRAPEGIPVVFGAALATALEQAMPQASLHFLPEGLSDPEGLREGRIDLDIGGFRAQPREVEVTVLYEQKLVGAVRAGHPLRKGRVTLKRFVAERHVAMTLRPGELSPVDAALAQAGVERFIAISVPSAHGVLLVASRGDLVACVPERTARAMHAGLGLELFDLPLPVPALPMALAWHPRHGADPAHSWLRRCMQQVLTTPRRPPPAAVLREAARPRG
ncbi:MAG: LysR family transcriptional regulator [Burkholderiales bacterium]|nr:LysR family transcriptional regulator [Burkholderiales bacterium]